MFKCSIYKVAGTNFLQKRSNDVVKKFQLVSNYQMFTNKSTYNVPEMYDVSNHKG